MENRQIINGDGNQAAGRDIINTTSSSKPQPGNFNMMECPVCRNYWVAKDANRCPGCDGGIETIRKGKEVLEVLLALTSLVSVYYGGEKISEIVAVSKMVSYGISGFVVLLIYTILLFVYKKYIE